MLKTKFAFTNDDVPGICSRHLSASNGVSVQAQPSVYVCKRKGTENTNECIIDCMLIYEGSLGLIATVQYAHTSEWSLMGDPP